MLQVARECWMGMLYVWLPEMYHLHNTYSAGPSRWIVKCCSEYVLCTFCHATLTGNGIFGFALFNCPV